ncbi:MAG: hypothetical protein E6Q97_01795 [Desulfurellales bacterium]|nr:MAG: hypothetical protein E6Q97_01795 [Desulfurellales bacterium]
MDLDTAISAEIIARIKATSNLRCQAIRLLTLHQIDGVRRMLGEYVPARDPEPLRFALAILSFT